MERTKPFPPNPIHRFYDWLDGLPIPMWLFYPLLLLLLGLFLHVLAWTRDLLLLDQFKLIYFVNFIWLVESLALLHFLLRASGPLLDGYRVYLDLDEKDFLRLRYEFTTIPNLFGSLFFLLGLVMGSVAGFFTVPLTPEIDFPSFAYAQWPVSMGFAMISSYFTIRQLHLIPRLFDLTKRIRLSYLEPIYAFSHYTAIVGFGNFMISAVNSF